MLLDFLKSHFITMFLILGLSLLIATRRESRDVQLRYFWLTIAVMTLLVIADYLETWLAQDRAMYFWRTLMSVLCYTLRPIAVMSLVLITVYDYRRQWLLWLPCVLNALIMSTAFFSPLAFYYDEVDYAFRRGPLGYTVFVITVVYLVLLFWSVNQRFGKNHPWEQRVLYFCAVFSAAAAVLDILLGGTRLSTSIMISAIFFYIFLRTQDTSRDALTHLLNRQSFYDDARMYEPQVSAVVSADMNGLKALNDSEGHVAGDRAIAAIGSCLLSRASRNVVPYRVGGDEFLILFLKTPEPQVLEALESIRRDVAAAGCSISIGVAFREENETIMELYRRSDERMYEDKEFWYAVHGLKR